MGYRFRFTALIAVALGSLLLVAAACGGADENGDEPGATNTPAVEAPTETPVQTPVETTGAGSSAELELTALNTLFDKDELVAPAGEPLTVTLHNQDAGIPHDFDIYELDDAGTVGDVVFDDGSLSTGIETTIHTVPALEAGTYRFLCSVHVATMSGTLTVE